MEETRGEVRGHGVIPVDCRCSTCSVYRERAVSDRRPPGRPGDDFDDWRRRLLPVRVVGVTVGILVAVTAPALARALAEQFDQPRSGPFTDVVGSVIPTLAAMPFLRLVAYRWRDALLIFFFPPAGIWLLGVIGWRVPVIRHPDWAPRDHAR